MDDLSIGSVDNHVEHEFRTPEGQVTNSSGAHTSNTEAQPVSVESQEKPSAAHTPPHEKNDPTESRDDASFALFGESFDNMSDRNLSPINATDSFALIGSVLSPSANGKRYSRAGRPTNIELPSLKHRSDGNASDSSAGDVSPIKVQFNRNNDFQRGSSREHSTVATPTHYIEEQRQRQLPPVDPAKYSNPYYVIRSNQHFFEGFKYLLSCLKGTDVCRVNMSGYSSFRHYKADDPTMPIDLKIGYRRVEAALCAFGGTVHPDQHRAIFRNTRHADRVKYEEDLPSRYSIHTSHISWKFEQEPPVDTEPPKPVEPCSSTTTAAGKAGKYRCKLCGQFKQSCPCRPQLQRSIGVMVYPAVNSFTAAEPGSLAPALDKMNNFVSYDSDLLLEQSPKRQKRDPNAASSSGSTTSSHQHSPDRFPFCHSTLTLRPEHYRAVTDGSYRYEYPAIPLTFRERKRLSDTLFCLSRQVPDLTAECAAILRQATAEWDQAVAELLTQVVIGLYNREGDVRLEGLQRYLVNLGVAC